MASYKRPKRDVPLAWRDALWKHLDAFRRAQPPTQRTQRALADALGVSNYTINGILNRDGPIGLDVLVLLRGKLAPTIDDLLGLSPIAEPKQLSPVPIQIAKFTPEQLEQVLAALATHLTPPKEPDEPPRLLPPARARRRLHE